jgi:RND family efflux transporter MFP subunit
MVSERVIRAVVVASALALAACSEGLAAQEPQQQVVPVKILALTTSPIDEYSEFIATIRSRRSIEIRPQVEGYVTRILVRPGEPVSEGAQLLQIDPKRQQATTSSSVAASGIASAEVDRSRAMLGQLEASRGARVATLKLAEDDHRRASALRQSGAIAPAAEEQASAALDRARAELAAAERQIAAQTAGISSAEKSLQQTQATAQAEATELQYYRISAPFSGTVGDVPVKVGDLVTTATLLTTVDDPASALEAWVSVPSEEARRLASGLTVRVLDGAGAAVDEGKIAFISPRIDPTTQSVLVKVELEGKPSAQVALRALQSLRARIVWATEPGIRIPLASVTRLNGQPFVFVVKDPDPARPRSPLSAVQVSVRLGDVQGNDVIVKEGLKPGDRIVSSGVQKIRTGSKIAPTAP